ncbi:uncharacterized protein LOC131227762 isoform X2 [Magnolia sinica]|uniref:uncharacterized protein LOC131227762 isoform X2 n=1 Tax=Magnolia sinica TaxID=86752 RepID=UPI0026583EAE|nr:uncharacterized protein LOC131227762 isoform X2 [Magnolia sinica]
MRIRNRSMQLSFSLSLPPLTPSDLLPHDKQDQDQEDPLTVPKETRSGLHPMAHHLNDRSDGLNSILMINKGCCMVSPPIAEQLEAIGGKEKEEEERWSAGEEGCMRNANVDCEGLQTTSNLSFSCPAGRWQEEERAFPLKKRKGSIDWGVKEETTTEKENNNNNNNNKTNKKLEGVWIHGNVKKKKGKASVAKEGSRCSRVNGRGWRCSQQTLVGYSLCDHHLGKGRLRSMASVRSGVSAVVVAPTNSSSSSNNNVENDNDRLSLLSSLSQGEEKLVMMLKNKKKKNGMVKARSISSLLARASTPRKNSLK